MAFPEKQFSVTLLIRQLEERGLGQSCCFKREDSEEYQLSEAALPCLTHPKPVQ